MPLPPFVPSVSQQMRQVIDAELTRIETEQQVHILFAIESGSRAWGFPSQDSDYDVRFVYARPVDWYLSIEPGRDVIEKPISNELDVSGWDLKKALKLLLKPNPVLYEWLSSPIAYRRDEDACARLATLSRKPMHRTACLHHYLHLGEAQIAHHRRDSQTLKLKSYFYMLRPALAIRWMRQNPESIPPMNIQELVARLEMPANVVDLIAVLIDRKSRMVEAERISPIEALDIFIRQEFDWAYTARKDKHCKDLTDEANGLFRSLIGSQKRGGTIGG